MKILLVSATLLEIEPFITGNQPKNADVLITGVGVAATIYQLQKKLQQNNYDIVLQAGIAGCFSSGYSLGETVVVKKDTFADLGTEEKGVFSTIFESNLADENMPPYEKGWLSNDNSLLSELALKVVTGVSVNKVSDSELQKKQLMQHFDPDIETMEGAASHYVCLQENIPFLQIKSISNFVGERDKTKWELKKAVENLNIEINRIVQLLNNRIQS